MRNGLRILSISIAGIFLPGLACAQAPVSNQLQHRVVSSAPQRLVMPYSCNVENGSVVVNPGPEQAFRIFDAREERPFTTCDPPFSNNCSSLTVHRFEIACGRNRVSWTRVVAAIGRTSAGTAHLEKGHIVLTRKADGSMGRAPSCADAKGKQPSSGQPQTGECLPWRVARATDKIVLPAGFAPAREVRARFVDAGTHNGTQLSQVSSFAPVGPFAAGQSTDGAYELAIDDLLGTDALSEIELAGFSQTNSESDGSWLTTVQFTTETSSVPDAASGSSLRFAFLAGLLGLMAFAAAWVSRARQQAFVRPIKTAVSAIASGNYDVIQARCREGLAQVGARVSDVAAQSKARLRLNAPVGAAALEGFPSQVRAAVAQAREEVSKLRAAPMIFEVLDADLRAIEDRLGRVEAGIVAREGSVMGHTAQLREIMRDLDKIFRIVGSATAGLSEPPSEARMPDAVSGGSTVTVSGAQTTPAGPAQPVARSLG